MGTPSDDDESSPPAATNDVSTASISASPPPLPSTWKRNEAEEAAFSTPNRLMLVTYNVNSIRTITRRLQLSSFSAFLSLLSADLVCLQETKVSTFADLTPDLVSPDGYDSYWSFDVKNKGRNGVVTYVRHGLCRAVREGVGKEGSVGLNDAQEGKEEDEDWTAEEGRMVVTDHSAFILINCYFPNGHLLTLTPALIGRVCFLRPTYSHIVVLLHRWTR